MITFKKNLTMGIPCEICIISRLADNFPPVTHKCPLYCTICDSRGEAVKRSEFIPGHMFANAPCEGFMLASGIRVGNTDLLWNEWRSLDWRLDLFEFAQGKALQSRIAQTDTPILPIGWKQSCQMIGKYTGIIPAAMKEGDSYELVVQLSPAPPAIALVQAG